MENGPEDRRAEAPSKVLTVVWRGINVLAAVCAGLVLLASILVPSVWGSNADPNRGWQIAGFVAFLLAVYALLKWIDAALLILLLACAFFFTSCVANFRWMG